MGSARPRSLSRVSSQSFCTVCGSTGLSSTGRLRRLPRSAHKRRSQGSRSTAGKDVPAGTVAVVRSLDAWRALERATALSTLIHQRRLTPSCGGHDPDRADHQSCGEYRKAKDAEEVRGQSGRAANIVRGPNLLFSNSGLDVKLSTTFTFV